MSSMPLSENECAARDLCGMPGIPIPKMINLDTHKHTCINCYQPMLGVICGHLFMDVLHEVDKYRLDSSRGDETNARAMICHYFYNNNQSAGSIPAPCLVFASSPPCPT